MSGGEDVNWMARQRAEARRAPEIFSDFRQMQSLAVDPLPNG